MKLSIVPLALFFALATATPTPTPAAPLCGRELVPQCCGMDVFGSKVCDPLPKLDSDFAEFQKVCLPWKPYCCEKEFNAVTPRCYELIDKQ
ncbi:hypothetical protein PT974_06047 [Cladobotryum mycophilum]|uniref:Hydrophobin n=1 Tax=Cladobotryum mycophilum TaxID=491253 RepID=A0ABR0SKE5_9HYPO